MFILQNGLGFFLEAKDSYVINYIIRFFFQSGIRGSRQGIMRTCREAVRVGFGCGHVIIRVGIELLSVRVSVGA